MKRLKFKSGYQRMYLDKIKHQSGLSIDQLAKLCGVVGRSYRDWRREKLNMTVKAARLFKKKFGVELPEQEEVLINRSDRYKSKMSKRGGVACYKKYGVFATCEGRKKGGTNALRIMREKGAIPWPNEFSFPITYSADLAELVGILLGDGGITNSQVCITLNSEADKAYLVFVVDLIRKLFDFNAPWAKRKNCKANVIYCSGVKLVEYFISLGLRVGNKVKMQVDVPEWIKTNEKFSIACVRGLMDTDGGVFEHRYRSNGKKYHYLKICFTNKSIPLLRFMYRVLQDLSFNPKLVPNEESNKLWLYNQNEVFRYLREVETHNPRLLRKVVN